MSAWDLQLVAAGFALAMAAYVLTVWLGGRRFHVNLLVPAMILLAFAWSWQGPAAARTAQGGWREWLLVACMAWWLAAAHFYWVFLHGRRREWLERGDLTLALRLRAPNFWSSSLVDRGMLVMCGALPLATLPGAPWAVPAAGAQAAIAIMAVVAGTAESRNTVRATWDAYLFGATYWLVFCMALSERALPYTPFVLAVALGASSVRNLVISADRAERATARLQSELAAREADLAESYAKLREAERLQTLSEERRRLTQDMHDGLGSSLVSALRVVEAGRMSTAELEDVLKGCIDDLKLTIDSMEPVDADLLLLLATLRFRLGPRLSAAGITLRWEVSDLPTLDWLDPRNSLHILRVLQEAFANILKHTKASEIRVSTRADDGWVAVTIADNGVGFDQEAVRAGRGLANQQRRAQALGGEVLVEPSASGTRLTLRLPIERVAA